MPDYGAYRLSTPQVARLAEVPFRTLDHWVRTGLLTCSVPAGGKGKYREWTLPDIVRARTVAELRRHGLSLYRIRQVVEQMRGRWQVSDPLAYNDSRLVLLGDSVHWVTDGGHLMNILDGQLTVTDLVQIPYGALVTDTRRRVREIAEAELRDA